MQYFLLLLPIVVPVIFWAGYHYYKDRHRPEPIANLVICFVLGVGSYWLGSFSYQALGLAGLRFDAYELAATSHLQLFVYAVFVIGGIEETVKMLPFLIVALRFRAFDDQLDGIVYASFIALGFAAQENLHYLQFLESDEALYRGFASPLVHIAFASVWGYHVGVRWLAGKPVMLVAFVSVTIAALLHGVYDFIVIAWPPSALPLSALLILGLWVWRLFVIRAIKRRAGHID